MVTVHDKHFPHLQDLPPVSPYRRWLRKTPVVSSNRSGFKKEETPLAFVKGFHKLSDVLDTLCSYIIVVMLGAMVIITGAQIVCRMAFTALSWSEEATRYLLVWSSFLGASCVYKHSGHISITFIQDMVPAAFSKILKLLVHVICCILFVVVIIYGMKYFGKQTRPQAFWYPPGSPNRSLQAIF